MEKNEKRSEEVSDLSKQDKQSKDDTNQQFKNMNQNQLSAEMNAKLNQMKERNEAILASLRAKWKQQKGQYEEPTATDSKKHLPGYDSLSCCSDSSIDAAIDGCMDHREDGPKDCFCNNPTYQREVQKRMLRKELSCSFCL